MDYDTIKLLSSYSLEIAETDVLDHRELNPVIHGLFGEVGSIMSTAKKHVREQSAFAGHTKATEEEFGDSLWYFSAICRRLNISVAELFQEVANLSDSDDSSTPRPPRVSDPATSSCSLPRRLDAALSRLGKAAADLLGGTPKKSDLLEFVSAYLQCLQVADLRLDDIISANLLKARGAFATPSDTDLCSLDFDRAFPLEEQLPRSFAVRVVERGEGKSYLQWRGVFIGDPLTDNSADQDGYRFHDVFHFAHAAVLHWSPVTRALIKQKRKSDPKCDEEQDSGRAIVVEEGISAWLFSRAKELNFFENQDKVSLGILKTISEFVRGYEVERCPMKLWEKAILDGYSVFRQLKTNRGGWIIGNRDTRTIDYAPLESAP